MSVFGAIVHILPGLLAEEGGLIGPLGYKGRKSITVPDAGAYTVPADEVGACYYMDNAAAQSLVLDDAAFKLDEEIEVYQLGAGAVTFSAGVDTSAVNGVAGPAAQYARVVVKKVADGVFNVAI